ncbi:MAG: MFS transporter [Caldilineaceae bacterium]|nr:MFS transporter [Caldilineaceae bacterium]
MTEQKWHLGWRAHEPAIHTPALYYGWIVVGALAITEPISWGILFYGFGVLLTPIQQEMGWSQAQLTGAFSFMMLVSGLAGVPIGHWLDRHGARGLMTLGSCLATLAIIAWAQVERLTSFYLLWGAIGVINAMILYEPAFAVTATWFVRQRTLALTVLTFGGGLASVIFVPLITWLVQLYGWRSALWLLAALLALTTIPLHALLLRRSPADLDLVADGEAASQGLATPHSQALTPSITVGAAMRTYVFWLLSVVFALANLSAIALAVHLLPYLTLQGYSPAFAALTASVLGGSQIPGRLIFGPLGRRLSSRRITAILFGMMTLGLTILLLAPTAWLMLVGATLFGMGSGASSPARAALVAEFYGIGNYGTINGVMALVLTLTRAGAPVAMGLLYTWTGDYTAVFWVLIASAAGALIGILATREPTTVSQLA